MVLPAVVAALYVLAVRPHPSPRQPELRGLWVVALGLAAHLLRFEVLPADVGADRVVGVVHGVVALLCAGCFVALNWATTHGAPVRRTGILASGLGAGLNAIPVALTGAMPVLRSAAVAAGLAPADLEPVSPQYVLVHAGSSPTVWLGDVIPVPAGSTVLSLGDLLLFAGLAILVGVVLASRLGSPSTTVAVPLGAANPPAPEGKTT